MDHSAALEKREEQAVARQEPTRGAPRFRPVVDILEVEDELRVVADMPGVRSDDIDIKFENGVLSILGRVEPRQDDATKYLVREYGVGDFYRVFEVSETVDSSAITAEYSDGVLTLHLPKQEKARARKIEVQASKN